MARRFAMVRPDLRPAVRGALSIGAFVVGLAAAVALDRWLGGHHLTIFLSAVLAIGLLTGTRAAIASVFLYTLAIPYLLFEPVGSIVVANRGERHALVVFVLAGLIVAAVAGRVREIHARLLAERAHVTRLRALASEFSAAVTPEQVAEVAFAACDSISAWCASIACVTGDAVLETLYSHGAVHRKYRYARRANNPNAVALRARKPLWLSTPKEIDAFEPTAAAGRRDQGVAAWAAVPLLLRGEAIGVLGIGWAAPTRVSPADREFILAVSSLAAQALDRAHLYEQARERETWFRILAENAPDMLFRYRVKDSPGFEYVSPSAAALTGYAAAEFYANPALALTLVHPDDAPTLADAIHSTAAGRFTVRWIARDRRILHVDLRTSAILDREGATIAVEGIARDVTERVEAQATTQRLLEEDRRRAAEMSAVLDSMAEGVIVTDGDGRVLRVNRAAESLLDVSPEEIERFVRERGAIPSDRFTTMDGRPVVLEDTPAYRARRGEVVRGIIYRVRRREPDALPTLISVSAAPIVNPSGQRLGAVVTATDVTRIHELQEEREDLLRAVSHDVRTPLQSVLLRASVLSKHACADSEEVQTASRSILDNVRRMNVAIDEVLEMTRLSSGELKPKRESVVAMPFLTEMIHRLFSGRDAARIRVRANPDLTVSSDPHHLERIVTNLLTNALKYSSGPVELSARPEGGHVVISVADHGPGIPAEDLPRVFDRYFRAGRHERTHGFGLGLYVTRRLAEAQGGSVCATSSPSGSVFEVRLRAACDE
jgi:PAS domain S-box-containing protein